MAVRKVKNLLIGMPPTDEDVALVTASGAAGLQQLVAKWQTTDPFKEMFAGKMVGFFRNAFQQTGFTPTEDFKLQLLTNGGFDFGPGGARLAGDDAFPRLVQNLQDSFAKTAWQIVQEGRPFTEVLTTNKFVMTTALKSLYIQVEMPADAPFNNGSAMPAWKLDYSGNPIPIEQAISTMTFSDEAPATGNGNGFFTNCRGGATVPAADFRGTSLIFQRLLGFTPRFPFSGSPTCGEQPSKPYFTTADLTDWTWVTINHKANAGRSGARDPALRSAGAAQREGADAVAAAHRLLHDARVPGAVEHQRQQPAPRDGQPDPAGRAGAVVHQRLGHHAPQHGRPRFHARGRRHGVRRLPQEPGPDAPVLGQPARLQRPQRLPDGQQVHGRGGQPAAGHARAAASRSATSTTTGPDITAVGTMLARVTRRQPVCTASRSPSRRISASGPTRRRAARATPSSAAWSARSRTARPTYNFAVLIKEFFASPLVTGAVATGTYPTVGSVPVSISRRDHFCAALSNRLGKPDLCAQAVPVPNPTQTATATIAQSVASRRVQPRLADPGHAVRSDAVLSLGQRAPVLEHRGAGRRPDGGRRRLLDERRPRRHQQHGREPDGLSTRPPGPRRGDTDPAGALRRRTDDQERARGRRRDDQRDQRAAVDVHPGLRVTNRRRDRPLKGEPPMTRITRREGLLAGLFGSGYIGLRALATGSRLVPAQPEPRDRPGSPVRDHRAHQPAVPDRQHVEQRRSAQLQLPRHVRGGQQRPPDHPSRRSRGGEGDADDRRPELRRRAALGRSVGGELHGRQHGPAQLGGARPHVVLPLPHRHHRARRPAEGDEAARRHHRRRDGRVLVRQAPGRLLRHGAGGADRGRRARQRERAGQLRRPHVAVDLADPAQAAADRARAATR